MNERKRRAREPAPRNRTEPIRNWSSMFGAARRAGDGAGGDAA